VPEDGCAVQALSLSRADVAGVVVPAVPNRFTATLNADVHVEDVNLDELRAGAARVADVLLGSRKIAQQQARQCAVAVS
jgi:hypothetical protein